MNLAEWLARSAKIYPQKTALVSGDVVVANYRSFAATAGALGAALANHHDIRPGDRVALYAKNAVEYLQAIYGVWYAGAAVVPINAKLHPKEAAWIIEDSGAKVAFVTGELGKGLKKLLPATCGAMIDFASGEFTAMTEGEAPKAPIFREQSDMAWLFYTSGTTGKPKGVIMTHANIQAMAHSYFVSVDNVFIEDAALYAAPISHGAGLYNVMHVMKAACHVVPASGGFDPVEIFQAAHTIGNLHMFAAPTMVRRLVDHAKANGEAGEGIRTIVYGGGPMYLADIVEAVDRLGPRFVQIYGQGECPMCITALAREHVTDRSHYRWRERLGSVGTAQSCVEVCVVDKDGEPMPPGESGEIAVRGDAVMAGYWNNDEATKKTIRDGWLWTGDMGVLDEDGFLTLKDRSKDVIISGGTNIYPREVEEALLTHRAVHEVSVIGIPDTEWGEAVCAFVVLAQGQAVNDEELDRHCIDAIARFKRPKTYRFVDALPKNNYGKVLKTELRERVKKENET